MQVLGGLVKLASGSRLPLPWWHRAPLGLLNKTTVHVVLTHPGDRPCGDLLVSVIDPGRWKTVHRLDARAPDEAGVLTKAFGAVFPLNIALAEAATVFSGTDGSEYGREHAVTLFCERPPGLSDAALAGDVEEKLRNQGFRAPKWSQPQFPEVAWSGVGHVDHGLVEEVDWRAAVMKKCPRYELCDVTRAVVSADTKQRLLRFVFPRRGAASIRIIHRDEPGVLEKLTQLFQTQANILDALLRRGGATAGNAILSVTVEPLRDGDTEMLPRVLAAIDQFDDDNPTLRIKRTLTEGHEPDHALLYPTHPDSVVARPPEHLIPLVTKYRRRLAKDGRTPVFVSRRFFKNAPDADGVKSEVHKVLREFNCEPVEASISVADKPSSHEEVDATMWACSAGLMLVCKASNVETSDLISRNVTQEFGFLRGQGKPTLPLIEDGCAEAFARWTNTLGLNYPRFASGAAAFDPSNPNSIREIIRGWVFDKQLAAKTP